MRLLGKLRMTKDKLRLKIEFEEMKTKLDEHDRRLKKLYDLLPINDKIKILEQERLEILDEVKLLWGD